jgi:hypothetical protein
MLVVMFVVVLIMMLVVVVVVVVPVPAPASRGSERPRGQRQQVDESKEWSAHVPNMDTESLGK